MSFSQFWRLISLSLLCLLLSGCLHMDVVFKVQPDGSGTITETTRWPANHPLLRQFGGNLPPMSPAKHQALQERARNLGSGVTASEQTQVRTDGQVDHIITFQVPNFHQLHYALDNKPGQKSQGLQYGFELVRKAGQPVKLIVNNDPFVISLFEQGNTPKQDKAASANEGVRQLMTTSMQAMAGMALDVRLEFAGEPLKSTAAFQKGLVATLFHMDVDQLTAKADWQSSMLTPPPQRATGVPCTYDDQPGMRVDCQRTIEVWLR